MPFSSWYSKLCSLSAGSYESTQIEEEPLLQWILSFWSLDMEGISYKDSLSARDISILLNRYSRASTKGGNGNRKVEISSLVRRFASVYRSNCIFQPSINNYSIISCMNE